MSPLVPLGDGALEIRMGEEVSPEVNDLVVARAQQIQDQLGADILYITQTYNTILVGFDPTKIDFEKLETQIKQLPEPPPIANSRREIRVPVCYESAYGLDWDHIEHTTGMLREEVISMHTGQSFRVYMLGFVPGFVYLGTVPKPFQMPRLKEPRKRVPQGSVAIAGWQTGIYPSITPGGWNILGRTPMALLSDKPEALSPFSTGDQVRFQAISLREFDEMQNCSHREIQLMMGSDEST